MTRNNKWLNNVINKKITTEKLARFKLQRDAAGNTRQDLSRPVLEQLYDNGYTIVRWDSGVSTHMPCIELNNQQWTLADFISGLEHDAPIFERSHPGDANCSLQVVGDGLPTVRVDSYGNVDEEEPALTEEPAVEEVQEVPEPKPRKRRRTRRKKQPKVPSHGFRPGTSVKLKPEYGMEWERDEVYEVLPDEVDTDHVLLMDEQGEIFRVFPNQIERI